MKAVNTLIQANGFHDPITVSARPSGRYVCISGHQRKLAMQKIGAEKIPCYVVKNLSEKQERDLWRSSNLIHRKLSPYHYAKLAQSYMEDFTKYKLKGVGSKRKYAAEKCGIDEGPVDRYMMILKMPHGIQERCKDSAFPYLALADAVSFDAETLALLENRIDSWFAKNPNLIMEKSDLKRIINKVREDSKYEDTSKPVDLDTPAGNNADDFLSENYRQYVEQLRLKTESRYPGEDAVQADNVIGRAAEDLFAVVESGRCVILNEVTARSALKVLKEMVKQMEKLGKLN